MIIVPNLQGGGQERVAALTSKIIEDDYEIVFVVFNVYDTKYSISDKAKLINLNIPDTTNKLLKILNVFRRTLWVQHLRKTEKIDYCFSFGRTANIVNCLSRGNGKTVVSIRNSSKLETGERNNLNSLIYSTADLVVCVSKGQELRILNQYKNIQHKIKVLYNPCDVETLSDIRKRTDYKQRQIHTIYSCGRLETMKCYKNLFNVMRLVHDKIKDVKLIVLGEGSQRGELESYISDNDMDSYIELAGFKDNPFEFIARGELFVFASAREGFPNVIIEALASGVPVISTDCEYGPREILSGISVGFAEGKYEVVPYGVLVPSFKENDPNPKDKEEIFASAVVELLENEELKEQLKIAGVKRASDFSRHIYKDRIKDILDSLE